MKKRTYVVTIEENKVTFINEGKSVSDNLDKLPEEVQVWIAEKEEVMRNF